MIKISELYYFPKLKRFQDFMAQKETLLDPYLSTSELLSRNFERILATFWMYSGTNLGEN